MERGIGFEEIQKRLAEGGLLDVTEHPNRKKYPAQKILVVEVDGYAWMVPYVENDAEIFFKTAVPNRKLTDLYLGRRGS